MIRGSLIYCGNCSIVEDQGRGTHSMKKRYYCPSCNHGFTLERNLNSHIRHQCETSRGSQRPRQYVCVQCGRRYVNGKDLKRHEKYGCDRTPRFQCPYCDHRAKYRSTIYSHVRSRHPNLDVATLDLDTVDLLI